MIFFVPFELQIKPIHVHAEQIMIAMFSIVLSHVSTLMLAMLICSCLHKTQSETKDIGVLISFVKLSKCWTS